MSALRRLRVQSDLLDRIAFKALPLVVCTKELLPSRVPTLMHLGAFINTMYLVLVLHVHVVVPLHASFSVVSHTYIICFRYIALSLPCSGDAEW